MLTQKSFSRNIFVKLDTRWTDVYDNKNDDDDKIDYHVDDTDNYDNSDIDDDINSDVDVDDDDIDNDSNQFCLSIISGLKSFQL